MIWNIIKEQSQQKYKGESKPTVSNCYINFTLPLLLLLVLCCDVLETSVNSYDGHIVIK